MGDQLEQVNRSNDGREFDVRWYDSRDGLGLVKNVWLLEAPA